MLDLCAFRLTNCNRKLYKLWGINKRFSILYLCHGCLFWLRVYNTREHRYGTPEVDGQWQHWNHEVRGSYSYQIFSTHLTSTAFMNRQSMFSRNDVGMKCSQCSIAMKPLSPPWFTILEPITCLIVSSRGTYSRHHAHRSCRTGLQASLRGFHKLVGEDSCVAKASLVCRFSLLVWAKASRLPDFVHMV